MLDKKITFCATERIMADIWPNPTPASRFIPDEYKKLKRFIDENKATIQGTNSNEDKS